MIATACGRREKLQQVKGFIGKDEVPSSNLGSSSNENRCPARDSGFLLLSEGEAAQQETHTETHTDSFLDTSLHYA